MTHSSRNALGLISYCIRWLSLSRSQQRKLRMMLASNMHKFCLTKTKLSLEERKLNRRKSSKRYREANLEKVRRIKRDYCKNNRDKINRYKRSRNALPSVRIIASQRKRLRRFIASTTVNRSEMFGCTRDQLVKHIESQFVKGMTWYNQGRWHIDHIMPCSAFDLTNPEQVKVCFNWQNLRPIWAKKNLRKGKKITHPQLHLPIQISQ